MIEKCPKHPKYMAIHPPRVDCRECKILYEAMNPKADK